MLLLSATFIYIGCEDEFKQDNIEFPEITITDFSPKTGMPGTTVTITGTNFNESRETVAARVYFNGVEVTEFVSYSDNQMVVKVPVEAQSGKISMQVWKHIKDSIGNYTVIPAPVIESIASNSEFGSNIAFPGDEITITGSGFGVDENQISVSFSGTEAPAITHVQDDVIKVLAPEGFVSGNVELTLFGLTLVASPAIINPTASGDITPYFLENTGDPVDGGGFVRGDELTSRWGTLGAPWVTNMAALNKDGSVGGYATEPWGQPEGYICIETWGNTPVTDGKIYQKTSLELPAGSYTLSFEYYSEIQTNSSVHCVVAAGGDGIPSLADLSNALGYAELANDAVVGTTSPNSTETQEVTFTIETSQVVSIGYLVNMKWGNGSNDPGSYFTVKWMKLVKN